MRKSAPKQDAKTEPSHRPKERALIDTPAMRWNSESSFVILVSSFPMLPWREKRKSAPKQGVHTEPSQRPKERALIDTPATRWNSESSFVILVSSFPMLPWREKRKSAPKQGVHTEPSQRPK
jgi:hypothetical protein